MASVPGRGRNRSHESKEFAASHRAASTSPALESVEIPYTRFPSAPGVSYKPTDH